MEAAEFGLGATIRAWRHRIDPASVGRSTSRRHRTPGLRREDLAELAGVSVDYIVRLEQGRARTPSAQVAAALARALQLSTAERDHLYQLAGLLPPSNGVISEHIPPGMQRLLNRLGPQTPVAVFAADWQLVWWNAAWASLLGDPNGVAPEERNLVHLYFGRGAAEPSALGWPIVSADSEATTRAIVADLRRASARYPSDARLRKLIDRQLAASPEFARLWHQGGVGGHAEERKTIHHPQVGEITVDCDVLVDTDTDLKIVVYTVEPGSDDQSKLELALVTGGQSLARSAPGGRSRKD